MTFSSHLFTLFVQCLSDWLFKCSNNANYSHHHIIIWGLKVNELITKIDEVKSGRSRIHGASDSYFVVNFYDGLHFFFL